MLEFTDYIYIGLYVLVILVLKEIIEYVFITRRGGNVITIEETVSNTKSNTKTNEIGTNTRFKKKKGGKNDKVVEGFAAECTGSSGSMRITSPLDSLPTNCEKATWLFCDDNFDKLMRVIKCVSITDIPTGSDGFSLYTWGGEINTQGGKISTGGGELTTGNGVNLNDFTQAITIEKYGSGITDTSGTSLEGITKTINFNETVYLTKGLEVSGLLHKIDTTTNMKEDSDHIIRIFNSSTISNSKYVPYMKYVNTSSINAIIEARMPTNTSY